MQFLHSRLTLRPRPVVVHLAGLLLRALGARLSLLQHHRDPMAREQLFAGLQGLGLISSKHRHHRNALGQVNDHIKQQDNFQEKPTNSR